MEFDEDTIYGPCSICGAVQTGAWPHPLGQPCPTKRYVDDAYVDMLNAQRESFETQRKSFENYKPPNWFDLFKR